MAKFSISNFVTILLVLIAASAIDQTNAKCCQVQDIVLHVCMSFENEMPMPLHKVLQVIDNNKYWLQEEHEVGRPKCYTQLCADGGEVTHFYCGIGDCNVFGCDCDDGCRPSPNNGTTMEELKVSIILLLMNNKLILLSNNLILSYFYNSRMPGLGTTDFCLKGNTKFSLKRTK